MTLGAGSGVVLTKMYTPARVFARDQRPKRSRVAILSANSYSDKLDGLLYDALRLFALDVEEKPSCSSRIWSSISPGSK